ncbi:Acyl carrier protein [Methylorubrum aminovorans]
MDLQTTIRDAILTELQRQAEATDAAPKVSLAEDGFVDIKGRIDIDALIMVITGSLAGGP